MKPANRLFISLTVVLSISSALGCTTPSPSPTPTVTATSTASAMPTATVTSTASAIPTVTDTSTPVPTPILSLPTRNPGCQLPCWWGINPGHTTWEEAERLLSPFSYQLKKFPDAEQMYLLIEQSPETTVSGYFSVSFYAHNGVIQEIKIVGIDRLSDYSLPVLLADLGPPTEIWVHTFSSFATPENTPFIIFFLYRELGILAQYDTGSAEFQGDLIRACAADLTNIRVLRLWNSELDMDTSMPGLMKEFDFGFDGSLLLSTDALGLDAPTFTKIYAGVAHPCFITPRKKWPGLNGLPYNP